MPDTSPSQLDAAVPLGARFRSSITGYGIVWVTIALFILLTLTTAPFLTEANLRNILDQQATLLIAASLATVAMIAG